MLSFQTTWVLLMDAAEAYRLGLVNEVVPQDQEVGVIRLQRVLGELRLDVDAGHIKRLAIYPDDSSHFGVAARSGTSGTEAAVEN